ncbi:unnamed protein product [Clonostachys byssicola]|uniref:Uncharacterized protein n=1 Tax=Clonostachys byssicola TaxID=160290 RepID=A0A9N9YCN1_9HYPO|nr:unnamed protein product [Clonostachys byssicola]
MSNAEVLYEDEDIRSSPAHMQVVELSALGSHPATQSIAATHAFEPVKCVLRLVQQVYYILTIQSALAGQRFWGDAKAEAQNRVLRLAWLEQPLHAVENCWELIKPQLLGPHMSIFDVVNCKAMVATLWNRPEFHIDGLGPDVLPIWDDVSLPKFFSRDIAKLHSAPIVYDDLPTIFRVGCAGHYPERWDPEGREYRYIPAIFAATPADEPEISVYELIESPSDAVYALVAIVEERRWKKPAVKRYNPLAYRIFTEKRLPKVENGRSRFMIFYAKFRRGDLDPGGRVQQMLNIGDGDDALARPVEDALPGLMEGLELGSGQADEFGAGQEIAQMEGKEWSNFYSHE